MLFTDGFAQDPSALILNIMDAQSRCAAIDAVALSGQTIATCFRAEWDQKQSQRKSNRSHRDRSSQRAEMADPRSHQKGDSSTAESGERGGKRECAGPAFRGVLLGQPRV
jgi:hypothetical protein